MRLEAALLLSISKIYSNCDSGMHRAMRLLLLNGQSVQQPL
jgi:hypothetical protein